MSITRRREVYAPFEYPKAFEYWSMQQQAHWLHTEISMSSDMQDWKHKLSDSEKNVVSMILKGFTQMEVVVNDYWTRRVSKWFPKPEIVMMATAFGSMETIHAVAYAYLNESLGLDDFSAFLEEPTAKAKIDNLINTKGTTKRDIAQSLAIFSAFGEGVQLFSSFAVLMNFQRFNKLKGVGRIVAFSVRDESLHSEAGCWLFRQFIAENPDIWDHELKKTIYDAARNTVALEDAFINSIFSGGEVEGIDPTDLKSYIRMRTNTKLIDLGLKQNWKNIDKDGANRIATWFDFLTVGEEHQDFFSQRVTEYSRGNIDWGKMYD